MLRQRKSAVTRLLARLPCCRAVLPTMPGGAIRRVLASSTLPDREGLSAVF